MSISYVGGESAEGTTVSLPVGAQANDLAILLVVRDDTTDPSTLSGWTPGYAVVGTAFRVHSYSRRLTAADITAGTVTHANGHRLQLAVYRGAAALVGNTASGNTGTHVQISGWSGLPTGAWAIRPATHKTATDAHTRTVTGWTNRSAGFGSNKLLLLDSNGPATGTQGNDFAYFNASGVTYAFIAYITAASDVPGSETYYPETDATFWQSPAYFDAHAITGADGGTVYRYVPSAFSQVWPGIPPMLLGGPGLLTIRTWTRDNSPAVSGLADVLIDGVIALSIPAVASGTASALRLHEVVIPDGFHELQINLTQGIENRWFWDGADYGPLPVPTASFSPDVAGGDAPLTVEFTDQSTGFGTLSWLWDFGDGQTSTDQNPTHVFTAPGEYEVSLLTTNEGGDSAPATFTITVVAADPTTKPAPEWDTSNIPTSSVQDVVNWYLAYSEDASSAAFSLVTRAVDSYQHGWDHKARLFWFAALSLWPDVETSHAGQGLAETYGLPD